MPTLLKIGRTYDPNITRFSDTVRATMVSDRYRSNFPDDKIEMYILKILISCLHFSCCREEKETESHYPDRLLFKNETNRINHLPRTPCATR